jgi:hypothetical protein
LDALHARLPHLRRNFNRSIFSCATFNFGPSVWTFKHTDPLNCPFGWCAIQALGSFDHRLGGHLILWDIKTVVQFPAGSTILIPSAVVTHSNIPVQPGERRASFTQYCSGGLFRWVDNGFRTEAALATENPDEFARMTALKETRWKTGLELLSTVDELLEKVDVDDCE